MSRVNNMMQMTMVQLLIVASQIWMFVGIVDGHHQTQDNKENAGQRKVFQDILPMNMVV